MNVPAVWMSGILGHCLPGDHVRLNGAETGIVSVSLLQFHARNREYTGSDGKVRDHQTPHEHLELRMDITANPGVREYPVSLACEILCSEERAAVLLFQKAGMT